jgi:hypothetical protein
MNLNITKIENNTQWLFTINRLDTTYDKDIANISLSQIMYFTFESAQNIAQFKQRLLTGLNATLNINSVDDKSYICVREGWCEFFIYTKCASMSCGIALEDCFDELVKFVNEY